jgi:tripartite-type tricarboxylate transporter receptor subunit TctC
MSRTLFVAAIAAVVTWCGGADAQEKFPSRPIEIIVNFGTGGGADQLGRIASQILERILGVALPVSNVVGASGNTGWPRWQARSQMATPSA